MSNSELIGSSTKFRAVFEAVGLVAPADSAVLIRAKPAPARKVIAQAIHEASSRRNSRFVSLNCAAIRFAGFAEIRGIHTIHGSGTATYLRCPVFSLTWKWHESCVVLD
jgi:transcriptional regulator with AAA-type ATPase domain